jgi:hypothetical protein
MTQARSLKLAAGCLALGLVGQYALAWHLQQPDACPGLKASLEQFPLEIEALPEKGAAGNGEQPPSWKGKDCADLETFRAQLPYTADSLVWRRYQPTRSGPVIDLYLVHTRDGSDRKHHPEVCIREVAGAPEDPAGRMVIYLDRNLQRPVQRFRFRLGATVHATVYYWHYSLEGLQRDRLSFLQKLNRRLSLPVPSVTAQVSLFGRTEDEELVEQRVLPAVDASLRDSLLPPTARIGCDRLPIFLLGN